MFGTQDKEKSVPPAVSEDLDFQASQAELGRKVDSLRHLEQQQQECSARMNASDELTREAASLEKPDLDRNVRKARLETERAQQVCHAAREKALVPLRAYYQKRNAELVRALYAALETVIPSNEAVKANFNEAMAHGVQLSVHFWLELVEETSGFEPALSLRKRQLREEGIEVP